MIVAQLTWVLFGDFVGKTNFLSTSPPSCFHALPQTFAKAPAFWQANVLLPYFRMSVCVDFALLWAQRPLTFD